jgi:hypothetical protein
MDNIAEAEETKRYQIWTGWVRDYEFEQGGNEDHVGMGH